MRASSPTGKGGQEQSRGIPSTAARSPSLREGGMGGLSYEAAANEVVADACETMLVNSEAVQRLAREHMSTAQKIWEHIKSVFRKMQQRTEPRSQEAKLLKDQFDAMSGLWDAALEKAVEQGRSAKTAKKPPQSGNVKYTKRRENGKDSGTGQGEYQAWTQNEINDVQNIGRKSINDFTSEELQKVDRLAQRYFAEMGTKSPFFRSWFGDWRANDKTPVQIANKRGDARGVQHNEDTGWYINVSGIVFNETNRHMASFNKAARPYLPYINDIVSKAALLDTVGLGKAKSNNSLMMHSLYAVADIGNGPEVLKLFVEEMNDPNKDGTAKRAYQLQNIEKYQTPHGGSQKTVSLRSASSGTSYTVADLFAAVKAKDSSFNPVPTSKVVNEDGTPKVMYHGTGAIFTVFDKTRIGQNYAESDGGFFFTSRRQSAANYASLRGKDRTGTVMEVFLSIKEPYTLNAPYSLTPAEFYDMNSADIIREAEIGENDGVMIIGKDEIMCIGFEPNQVKSATDNLGSFDSTNPDIRYSLRDDTSEDTEQETAERVKSYNRLKADNEALKRQLERARREIKPTKEAKVRRADAVKAAKRNYHGLHIQAIQFRDDLKTGADKMSAPAR